MSAESCRKINKKPESPCFSADGATSIGFSVLDGVSGFSNLIESSEQFLPFPGSETSPGIYIDDSQCWMCHNPKTDVLDPELCEVKSEVSLLGFFAGLCRACEKSLEGSRMQNSPTSQTYSNEDLSIRPTNEICSCPSCCEREASLHRQKSSNEFRRLWKNLSGVIAKVYSEEIPSSLDVPLLRDHVTKLCQQNPHYLFKKLEKQCRQVVINMKIQILKRLTQDKDAEIAYQFISALFLNYNSLCSACEILAEFLNPLVDQHLSQFDATWELHDKHLFHCIIFSDPVVQGRLPKAVDCIKEELVSLQDQPENVALAEKYMNILDSHKNFIEEMTNISQLWKACQKQIEKYDENEKKMRMRQFLQADFQFLKDQRQFLQQLFVKGGSQDLFDNCKQFDNDDKSSESSQNHEIQCPTCKHVKCSYDEPGLSHLITCGIISTEDKQDQNLCEGEYNNSSMKSSDSSSGDSFLAEDLHNHEDRKRGDGGEDDDEDDDVSDEDDDDEEEEEEEEDDDDFQDAQQIHLPDFNPSIENSSTELVSRYIQPTSLLEAIENCSCSEYGKDSKSVCMLSYAKRNVRSQESILKFFFKESHSRDDEEEDEDYDIHEEGIHSSSDLECSASLALSRDSSILKSPYQSRNEYVKRPRCSSKSSLESDHHRFLLPTIEQHWAASQCSWVADKTRCLRLRMSERQSPTPPLLRNDLQDGNNSVDSDNQTNFGVPSPDYCPTTPAKASDNARKKTHNQSDSSKTIEDGNCCEIKVQRNEAVSSGCTAEKKSGKDRSTQHPEKMNAQPHSGDKKVASSCNHHQMPLTHLSSCQQQQQQLDKTTSSCQKVASGDGSSAQLQRKQGAFALSQQQLAKQQQQQSTSFRCRAPTCGGLMMGSGDGSVVEREECENASHQHLSSCAGSGGEAEEKSSGNQKETNGKPHCECWHCEFFGHETPSTLPVSRNFAECRDRLRQKLRKKQTSESTTPSSKSSSTSKISPLLRPQNNGKSHSSASTLAQLKSVEEIMDYINGKNDNAEQTGKEKRKESAAKKNKTGKNKKSKEVNSTKLNGSQELIQQSPVTATTVIEKKFANQPKSVTSRSEVNNTASSPSLKSQKLESSKTTQKINETEPVKRSTPNHPGPQMIPSKLIQQSPSSSSNSSLENSVSLLKINCSNKIEISRSSQTTISYRFLTEKNVNERRNPTAKELTERSLSRKDVQDFLRANNVLLSDRSHEKPSSSSASPQRSRLCVAGSKTKSNLKSCEKTNSKPEHSPPSSPQDQTRKLEFNGQKKMTDCVQKQENGPQKNAKITNNGKGNPLVKVAIVQNSQKLNVPPQLPCNEVLKPNNVSPLNLPASNNNKQNNKSTTCSVNNSIESSSRKTISNGVADALNSPSPLINGRPTQMSTPYNNIHTCNNVDNKNNNNAPSGGPSSPPGSSKSKKQKKRNKADIDLSFEEIFKPNDEDDLGEDDREVEEFKRFCSSTPLPVREKLRVSLNMKDIFSRRKPSHVQGCSS